MRYKKQETQKQEEDNPRYAHSYNENSDSDSCYSRNGHSDKENLKEENVYVFTKGAPEEILKICSQHFSDAKENKAQLDENKKRQVLELLKNEDLKTIFFAVKVLPLEEYEKIKKETSEITNHQNCV